MTDPTETWTIGTTRIARIVEMEAAVPPQLLLADHDTARLSARAPHLLRHVTEEGWLSFSIHGLVVDTGDRRILVDGGVGDGKPRPAAHFDRLHTRFAERMAAAGYPPESIDTVVVTHLHVDHVGWMTSADADRWVPTFPNARHLVVRTEHDHWRHEAPSDGDHLEDSVAPVVAAGLVDLVDAGHEVATGVRLVPTPGHTPGHVAVRVTSGGEAAILTGDLVHHPIQLLEPEWGSPFDVVPGEAARTRTAFADEVADRGDLVIGTHFGTPAAGHLVGDGHERRWIPVEGS